MGVSGCECVGVSGCQCVCASVVSLSGTTPCQPPTSGKLITSGIELFCCCCLKLLSSKFSFLFSDRRIFWRTGQR